MKFTEEHKKILKEFGYQEDDIGQIEEATNYGNTLYTLFSGNYPFKKRRISIKICIELLGIKAFLSGIGRSAFHWSAVRQVDDAYSIYFDSSNLFRSR